MPSLEDMSGVSQSAPKLVLNEISINGQTGEFFLKDKLGGLIKKDENDKIGKYAKKALGKEPIEVVFLKFRRILKQFRKEQQQLITNEHNNKNDTITLYGHDTVVRGTASDIRERFQGLRVQQIVYALYNGELVRILVKGASMGSNNKPEGVLGFYEYLNEFKKAGEHVYEYKTILKPVEEDGQLGPYFAMTYEKGEKIKDLSEVTEKMTQAFNFCQESDKYYSKEVLPSDSKEGIEFPEEDEVTEELPTDEINSDDIPF